MPPKFTDEMFWSKVEETACGSRAVSAKGVIVDNQGTIARLVDEGWHVKVRHLRACTRRAWHAENRVVGLYPAYHIRSWGEPYRISGRGGKTIVDIESPGYRFSAEAVCSDADQFCKRVGLGIALGRALAAMNGKVGAYTWVQFSLSEMLSPELLTEAL